ncbi:hypothetical protein G7Z17_g11818 [Cylindrodendrum hubeiense]|uniref:Uncharacterized protein n=1 Tax=Cylindrodendrum hubeiense TaxID=595255 RepID=A0A9P5L9W0_9HYPO|nr:hypothetical protein G7Z17_g11818 [Cylindrodendrum hubeiense]
MLVGREQQRPRAAERERSRDQLVQGGHLARTGASRCTHTPGALDGASPGAPSTPRRAPRRSPTSHDGTSTVLGGKFCTGLAETSSDPASAARARPGRPTRTHLVSPGLEAFSKAASRGRVRGIGSKRRREKATGMW